MLTRSFFISVLCVTTAWATHEKPKDEAKAHSNKEEIEKAVEAKFEKEFEKKFEKQFEAMLPKYLEKHPEIIPQALQNFQMEQQKKMIKEASEKANSLKDKLLDVKTAAVVGSGKKKIVAFTDPNCVHCRHFESSIPDLIKEIPDLMILTRPAPIFGEDSTNVSKLLLAAAQKNKLHEVMDLAVKESIQNPVTVQKIMDEASKDKKSDLNLEEIKKHSESKEIEKIIEANKELMEKLGVGVTQGVPCIFYGYEDKLEFSLPMDKDGFVKAFKDLEKK